MPVIGLIGPHAVGKTTAARRWAARYSGLTACLTDIQLVLRNGVETRVRGWKGTKEEKIELTREAQSYSGVVLVESARGFSTWLSVLLPTDFVIVITCSESLGRQWLEERRGGRKLSEYWTATRLEYECSRHLLNSVKRLKPDQVKHFEFTDRAKDWKEVDSYFSALYRKLNNR